MEVKVLELDLVMKVICYNPIQIIQYLKCKLKGKNLNGYNIKPYYEGFKGNYYIVKRKRYCNKNI